MKKERADIMAMSEAELHEAMAEAIRNAGKKDAFDKYRDIFSHRGVASEELAEAAFNAFSTTDTHPPFEMYYAAGDATRRKMIAKLMAAKDYKEGASLLCMLGIQAYNKSGGRDVLEAFLELERNPRPWRQKLYVNPSSYAEIGGWSFTPDGEFLNLTYDTCYPLVEGGDNSDKAAIVGRVRDDDCPCCGMKLVDLLTLDCTDPRLAHMGIDGIVTAIICPNCTSFEVENTFTKYSLDGKAELYKWEVRPIKAYTKNEDVVKAADNGLTLASKPEFIYYGGWDDITHTVGGMANWIQDWEYRECPDCGKKMKYYAQLSATPLYDMEGLFYLEICPDCQITAVFHQQT
jgi:hypothetical protein